MTIIVELTKSAKNDLSAIAQYYLSKAGIEVAEKFLIAIEDAVQSLTEIPQRGQQPHELYQIPHPQILEIIKDRFRTIYKILPERVVVIAIFDGRQDVRRHLRKRLTSLN